jgi:hypothetical protein
MLEKEHFLVTIFLKCFQIFWSTFETVPPRSSGGNKPTEPRYENFSIGIKLSSKKIQVALHLNDLCVL